MSDASSSKTEANTPEQHKSFMLFVREYGQLVNEIDERSKHLSALRKTKANKMAHILEYMGAHKIPKCRLPEGDELAPAVSKSTSSAKPERWRMEMLKHVSPDVTELIYNEVMSSRQVKETPTLKRRRDRAPPTDADSD